MRRVAAARLRTVTFGAIRVGNPRAAVTQATPRTHGAPLTQRPLVLAPPVAPVRSWGSAPRVAVRLFAAQRHQALLCAAVTLRWLARWFCMLRGRRARFRWRSAVDTTSAWAGGVDAVLLLCAAARIAG
eukprot:gene6323-18639_t